MNVPSLLLGATLLFWGWQTGYPLAGALMAVTLEGARVTRTHWEFSEEDFNRIWNFCALVFIGAAVFAFTLNQGPAVWTQLVADPTFATERAAGEASQRTAASLIQWLPMVFCPFVLAHILSRRGPLKLATFSLILRRRRRRGEPDTLGDRPINVGWVFFAICLVATSINTNEGNQFFAGTAVLLVWALCPRRSRRFALPVWAGLALTACVLGYFGQQQLGELRRLVENFSPQWPWRTGGHRTDPGESRTQIGQIGRLKGSGTIVIRLEPKDGTPPPALLRTASYRNFTNTIWRATNFRSEGGGRDNFGPVYAEPKSANWALRSLVARQKIGLSMYLDGGNALLPLPFGVIRLENLPAFSVKTNHLGAVLAEGPDVVVFDVLYAPPGSIDSPPGAADIIVPVREQEAVAKVLSEMHLAGQSTNQMLRTINAYFQDQFKYSTWQPARWNRGTNTTPLAEFLLNTRSGHCEYFATATVLLLRQLGIPARYATGWSVQEAAGKQYIVRERHAHAWCLYYHYGQWHDLDTTPASWSAVENNRASRLQFLADAWARVKFEFLKWRWGQSNLRDYVWWIVGPMLAFLLYRLVRHRPGSRPRYVNPAEAETLRRLGLDSEFFLVEKKLAGIGFVRQPAETLGQFLERALRDARVAALREPLATLLRLHYRLRFDPAGLADAERDSLRNDSRKTLGQLGAEG